MSKIVITTDSTADLSQELLEKYDIKVMPLIINLGDEPISDSPEAPQIIYDYVEKSGKTPKTAARSVEEYKEFFEKHKPAGGELIHFNISNKLSASHSMAVGAAEQVAGVHVVDTLSLSTGSGLTVLYGAELVAKGGLTAKEIAKKCAERAKYSQASFVLDSLLYLHKGGRCSGLAMLFASILKIKPMIRLQEGAMGPGKKYKGKWEKCVENYVTDVLEQFNTPNLDRVFITYTTLEESLKQKIKDMVLAKYPFKEVLFTTAGGTVTSHCGKNTVGVLYFNDGDK